jgi:anti-anti-sigma factor
MLAGELDTSTAGTLYGQFAGLAAEGIRHVALNLAELSFMDSTGLSVVVAEHKRVESMGGELIIFSPRSGVRRLFEMTGLRDYLNIRPLMGVTNHTVSQVARKTRNVSVSVHQVAGEGGAS